jgi:excisionase family DNA binding protein
MSTTKSVPTQPFMTVTEVAVRLGRSTETIRRWITQGLLKSRKLNHQCRVVFEDSVERLARKLASK